MFVGRDEWKKDKDAVEISKVNRFLQINQIQYQMSLTSYNGVLFLLSCYKAWFAFVCHTLCSGTMIVRLMFHVLL
jgi:hypothetical protein